MAQHPATDSASTATTTLATWRRLCARPGGKFLFSLGMALRAPYFRTVLPTVREMSPGKSVVTAPKWWGVHNHIGTFHAIAACNLAELAMGALAEATVPNTHRWIPKSMRTEYRTKATTRLRAVAELDTVPEFDATGRDVDVPISVYDTAGTVVVTVTITIWITPKKRCRADG